MVNPLGRSDSLHLYPPGQAATPIQHIASDLRALSNAKDSKLDSKRGAAALAHYALRGKVPSLIEEAKRQMVKKRVNSESRLRNDITTDLLHSLQPTTPSLEGISSETVRGLFQEFVNGGLGHVARGYKAAFLQTEDQLKTVEHIATRHALKDDFILARTQADAEQWENTSLLVNRTALLNVIVKYREEFEDQLKVPLTNKYGKKASFSAEEISDYVAQSTLPNDVIENDVVLGMLLGYGRENSKLYAAGEQYWMNPPSDDYQQAQNDLKALNRPSIPGFVSRKSKDNAEVIQQWRKGCEDLGKNYSRTMPKTHEDADRAIKQGLSEFFRDDIFGLKTDTAVSATEVEDGPSQAEGSRQHDSLPT